MSFSLIISRNTRLLCFWFLVRILGTTSCNKLTQTDRPGSLGQTILGPGKNPGGLVSPQPVSKMAAPRPLGTKPGQNSIESYLFRLCCNFEGTVNARKYIQRNNVPLLCELKQDKNIAQLQTELNKLATTVQKLGVSNVGDTSTSAMNGGRRRQPTRRPQFSNSQTGSSQDQPMVQVQQLPQPPTRGVHICDEKDENIELLLLKNMFCQPTSSPTIYPGHQLQ